MTEEHTPLQVAFDVTILADDSSPLLAVGRDPFILIEPSFGDGTIRIHAKGTGAQDAEELGDIIEAIGGVLAIGGRGGN